LKKYVFVEEGEQAAVKTDEAARGGGIVLLRVIREKEKN